MKSYITSIVLITLLTSSASAADVDARLSSREAYVGSPLTFQIAIADATDYEMPSVPAVDGCDIRSAGTPSQSSQVTISNGRRSEKRSVTMQYLVTPRREGSFTIPSMKFKVDGKIVATQPQRFVATKSETGDLVFVEIDGSKEKVYVGQPLELTLKIWIKPFRDPVSGQTLSEGDMWNMISDSTSWGGFSQRIKDMTENHQRPGGREVLRYGGKGGERAYYLYEINATVYPKRAGKIDASDVQVVIDYPTALGKSRSPFGSLLDDDFFSGNSMMSRMMDDDVFGSSFGSRMTVTQSRPVVGEASVDASEVLPVPTEGRPADYRGAVGRYRIVTHATPTTVDAGDPITLNIGIAGTGPMELVQAPPLHEQSDLTANFKVADESLAGFVKDDTKFFSTTIRPQREGITEIPAIRFSYFDPVTEKFQTVTSEAIAITVNKSETLALDSIVGNQRNSSNTSSTPNGLPIDVNKPDFTNHSGANVVISQSERNPSSWWWSFVIVPPVIYLGTVIAKYSGAIGARLPSFRSAKAKCLAAIARAESHHAITTAVVRFILDRNAHRRFRMDHVELDSTRLATEAVGSLRVTGLYDVACEVESFLANSNKVDVQTLVVSAKALIEKVDAAIVSNKKTRVKRMKRKRIASSLARPICLVLVAIASATASPAFAGGLESIERGTTQLSDDSALTVLNEATEAYSQGIAKAQTDPATAKEFFATAAQKYQLLTDAGIRNADLFVNLGNANIQTGKLGQAIANYEKALLFEPWNLQAKKNLAYAESKVAGTHDQQTSSSGIRYVNNLVTDTVGQRSVIWALALSSILFWGLLILRIVRRPFPVVKFAAVPLAMLLITLGSVALTQSNPQKAWNAIIVADSVSLHAGDGDQFAPVVTVSASQGHRVELLASRGHWSQVRTAEGHVGWVHDQDVELVNGRNLF